MLIYSPVITTRLHYMADFAGKEITGQAFQLTSDKVQFLQYSSVKINYSDEQIDPREFRIKPHPLLFETNIAPQPIECFDAGGYKAFFKTGGDLPFDIFAASFYLLTRYEEYLPHQLDMYGRYAHENSLAYKKGFLDRPLVNEWFLAFRNLLTEKFPASSFASRPFRFLPTYDIDIAWSYKHKGLLRTIGGLTGSLFKGQWRDCTQRIGVLLNRSKDPYDTYDWLHQLHQRYKLAATYFFLLAERTSRYDKNCPPSDKAMIDLAREHDARYTVGIHPSWRSGDEHQLLGKEINTLGTITGKKIVLSRQHYIRLTIPGTYRRLLDAGIRSDFSMGYGSINGFRASVATPFQWYDLEKEAITDLQLFPFCFMEANSFYEQKYSPGQALGEMRHYYKVISSISGTMISIWHNQFFGTDKLFAGWREIYEQFISEISNDIEKS